MTAFSPAAPRSAAPGIPSRRPVPAWSKSLVTHGRWADPALLLAWVLFTTVFTDGAAIARYLIVAYFI